MTRPMTPVEIDAAIEETIHTLNRERLALDGYAKRAAEAKTAFEVAFSQARLRVRAENMRRQPKITSDEVADEATVQTAERQLAHRIAENAFVSQRESVRALQSQLNGLQSLARSTRGL